MSKFYRRIMASCKMQKKLFRKKFQMVMASLTQEQVDWESKVVLSKVLESGWLDKTDRISIFVNTVGEISTEDLIMHCFSLGKKVFIPRFERGNDRMDMLRLNSVEEYRNLDTALWGIRQHHTNAVSKHFYEGVKSSEKPLDIIFMPGVAFTIAGQRIGHGKGFYDRFINEYKTTYGHLPLLVALALKAQIVDGLPPLEPHDVIVDHVVHA